MDAARGGHHECLSILLGHGAAVDKVDEVSVRDVCRTALLCDVAYMILDLLVTFVASAVNYSLAPQLSLSLLQMATMNACRFCLLMVPKSIKPMS